MKDSARITMVQMMDTGNEAPSIERMPAFFEQAVENGSDLIAFPEYILGNEIKIISSAFYFPRLFSCGILYALPGLHRIYSQNSFRILDTRFFSC